MSRIDVTGGTTTINSSAGISLSLELFSQSEVDQLRANVGVGFTRTYTVMSGVGSANFTPANLSFENHWVFLVRRVDDQLDAGGRDGANQLHPGVGAGDRPGTGGGCPGRRRARQPAAPPRVVGASRVTGRDARPRSRAGGFTFSPGAHSVRRTIKLSGRGRGTLNLEDNVSGRGPLQRRVRPSSVYPVPLHLGHSASPPEHHVELPPIRPGVETIHH